MELNKANKLTVLRLILIIPFLIFLSLSYINKDSNIVMVLKIFSRLIALGIFALAVATDYYDGKIARETDTVTDFGKLMDPIADKLLTFTFLLVLLKVGAVSLLLVLILLTREFLVTAERALVSNKGGVIIPASMYGKYKTIALYIALFVIGFIPNYGISTCIINSIMLLPAVILSIVSAIDYHNNAKEYIEF